MSSEHASEDILYRVRQKFLDDLKESIILFRDTFHAKFSCNYALLRFYNQRRKKRKKISLKSFEKDNWFLKSV